MSDATVLLSLTRVVARIGGRTILDGVDLHCRAGSVTALLGPNGAGKSTLLALAAGDRAADAGRVEVGGRDIGDWRPRALARQRAVLPQDHAVRFAFSVREVVAMGRLPHPPDPGRDSAIVDAALATADVADLADRDAQTLSGGEATRTAFARVLAQQAPLVLLDEPTAALDLHHQQSVLRAARALAADGACVVVVLHDLNLAAMHADRIAILAGGRLVADGPPRAVLQADVIERVWGQPVRILPHPSLPVPLVVVATD